MLSSPRSPRVREVAKLKTRTARSDTGLFLLEGPQALSEALAARARVHEIFFTAAGAERHPALMAQPDIEYVEVSDEALARMADTRSPQGFVAVASQFPKKLDEVLDGACTVVVLHEVRDPGNLGTVIRAADAAGFDAVVITAESVDVYNPKVVRATTGSLFNIPHAVEVATVAVLAALRARGIRTIAADVSGSDLRQETAAFAAPHAWLFGNEARGLDDATLSLADLALKVPIFGKAESLNLATAASVCLYHSAFALAAGADDPK